MVRHVVREESIVSRHAEVSTGKIVLVDRSMEGANEICSR